MIVLDTSAAIELLLNLPLGARVQRELETVDWNIVAPQLLTVEVLQVLRRRVNRAVTPLALAEEARTLLPELNIRFYDHEILADRIWQLRYDLTAYDAAFVDLAEILDLPLRTCDERTANAPGHGARMLSWWNSLCPQEGDYDDNDPHHRGEFGYRRGDGAALRRPRA